MRYQQVCPVPLHGVGRISQSLLVARLRTLEAAGVIERRSNPGGRWEYHPTRAGRELETVLNEYATVGSAAPLVVQAT